MSETTVGVLALQGDFELHLKMLEKTGVECREVRTVEHLDGVSGLIIPGGESTTVGKLLVSSGLASEIPKRYESGSLAIFGTCMGTILLAKDIENRHKSQMSLSLLDITVRRNSYGRQVDSFETALSIKAIGTNGTPVRAVFIRAPQILKTGPGVDVLADFSGLPVLVKQDKILACCFHPEITDDARIHKFFIKMCCN